MPHHARPFFRQDRQLWYVEIKGKQHRLGKHPSKEPEPKKVDGKWNVPVAIMQLYHDAMANQNQPVPPGSEPGLPAVQVLEDFMDYIERERGKRTFEWYRRVLKSFRLSLKEGLTCDELKPLHITEWLKDKKWSPSTRHGAIHAVKTAFRWAKKQGMIDLSPVAEAEAPSPTRREAILTPIQWGKILAGATDDEFRDLLNFLYESGARPQEACHAEARHFDEQHGRLIFPAAESKGRKHPRVIYLTPPALAIINRLCAKWPEGKLFRNSDGEPWNRNAIRCRFRRMRKHSRVDLKITGLCCYAIRHTYATQALQRGVDPITLAVLMGHSDASMIANVYQHLATSPDFLQDAAKKAAGEKKGEGPTIASA